MRNHLASEAETIAYDTLVYALGSHADLGTVPGAAEHATAIATAEHAQQLRERVRGARRIAVVGGGLTGIETVTELAETHPDRTVLLVTSGRPGAILNARARDHLHRTFDRLGIEVVADAAVAKVAQDGLLLESGDHVHADAVVWTTGFYGVGDAAAARNEDGREVRMGCGPGGVAGVIGALAVADRLAGRTPRPYRFHDQALHVSLGRRDGIVQFGMDDDGRVVTGRLAAFIKERVALRGSVWGLRHPAVAVYGRQAVLTGHLSRRRTCRTGCRPRQRCSGLGKSNRQPASHSERWLP